MVQWFWRRKWKCEKFIGRQMNKQTKGNQKSSTGLSFIWSSLSMYFRYFLIISPWKGVWPFIWTNLNSHHPRMLCAKFGWKWPCCSWEEDENVKSLQTDGQTDRQTDGRTDGQTTDNRRSEKLTWAFSSGELKTTCCISIVITMLVKDYYSKWNQFHNFCRSNCESYIYTTSQTLEREVRW